MLTRIQTLNADVIDQIAAGEVVERPSHLVKELVENSLDAGAVEIAVEFSNGGRFVKVSDNGSGIHQDDLKKSLERHATSKIKQTEDLWKLSTYGFRGEALASIAAVSKLTITSKTADSKKAAQIVSEFGARRDLEHVGGSLGTTVQVEDLFENVPARLKFMKSASAEGTQIKNTLKALALSYPHCEFKITSDGELVHFWPKAESKLERAKQVLGVDELYEGSAEREGVKAYSVFADPHNVAKTQRQIWLFAQNRWIQDRGLQAAVMEAYRSLLMHGEYPICVSWVETLPDQIDVNIHPTKSQVKFLDPSLAFRAVQASVRSTLEKAPWLGDAGVAGAVQNYSKNFAQPQFENLSFADQNVSRTQYQQKTWTSAVPAGNNANLSGISVSGSEQNFAGNFAQNSEQESEQSSTGPSFVRDSDKIFAQGSDLSLSQRSVLESYVQPPSNSFQARSAGDIQNAQNANASTGYWSSLQVLGQANLTYILSQSSSALVMVDQHAAHERVLFEKFMSAWKGGKMDVQDFLFPLAIDLSPEKAEALLSYQDDLEKLGVALESLGPSTVGVKSAPLLLKDSALVKVLEQMASDIVELGGSYSLERKIGDICATLACHSAIRAGQALSHEEMKALLKSMDENPLSSFCPHGRPVQVDYPFYKLEKDFGRIV